MANYEEKSDLKAAPWPSDPKHYQWKGTITEQNGSWHVLCHCKPRKEDVFLKIRSWKDDSDLDMRKFTDMTKTLINIQHSNLMTPVHAFSYKSDIFVVYPRHSGGPISEVLSSHYPHGIESEDVVASILYDTALGLQNLHNQQQCHRNIRADSLHIDIDEGVTLLSNFGTLKSIKWKRAMGRKNTAVTPDREPFTDPLILLSMDPNATWYTGDIYAFGITALQLTYGQPPILKTTNVLQNQYKITTDLYERKCPFSKSFESLIKDCCGPLPERISVNKLVEHKFFKGKGKAATCPNPAAIQNFFGHLLKSTEKRINSALDAPPSLKTLDIDVVDSSLGSLVGGNENVDDSNQGANALAHIHVSGPSGSASNVASPEMLDAAKGGDTANPEMDDHWSFSTKIDPATLSESLEREQMNSNANHPDAAGLHHPQHGQHPPTILENQAVLHQPPEDHKSPHRGPSLHNAISTSANGSVSFNSDPAHAHLDGTRLTPRQSAQSPLGPPQEVAADFVPSDEVMMSKRNYRFSFSANSESGITESGIAVTGSQLVMSPNSADDTALGGTLETTTPVPTKTVGRFKVAAGKMSVTYSNDNMDLSETNDDYDVEDRQDSYDGDGFMDQGADTATDSAKPSTRFIVSSVDPEMENSADEEAEGKETYLSSPGPEDAPNENEPPQKNGTYIAAQPPQQHQTPPTHPPAQPPAFTPPNKAKSEWTKEEVSQWVLSLGKAYAPYGQLFVEHGVDGDLLSDEDPQELMDMLKAIMNNKLHQKQITKKWNKLQT